MEQCNKCIFSVLFRNLDQNFQIAKTCRESRCVGRYLLGDNSSAEDGHRRLRFASLSPELLPRLLLHSTPRNNNPNYWDAFRFYFRMYWENSLDRDFTIAVMCNKIFSKNIKFTRYHFSQSLSTHSVIDRIALLEKQKTVLSTLRTTCRSINRAFSFSVFVFLSTKLVAAAFSCYLFIQGVIKADLVVSPFVWVMLSFFVIDCVFIVVIFSAADMPTNEVCV